MRGGSHWTPDLTWGSGRASWQRRPLGWELKGEESLTRQHRDRDDVEGEGGACAKARWLQGAHFFSLQVWMLKICFPGLGILGLLVFGRSSARAADLRTEKCWITVSEVLPYKLSHLSLTLFFVPMSGRGNDFPQFIEEKTEA